MCIRVSYNLSVLNNNHIYGLHIWGYIALFHSIGFIIWDNYISQVSFFISVSSLSLIHIFFSVLFLQTFCDLYDDVINVLWITHVLTVFVFRLGIHRPYAMKYRIKNSNKNIFRYK